MQAKDGKSNGLQGILLSVAAIALASMVGTIGLLRQVGNLAPGVGDIVTFDPLDPFSRDMSAQIAATQPGRAATCVLDVRTMHATGGSIMIESRQPQTRLGYRVHWAGFHTSDGKADCGASADMLLEQGDIETLAMAAGGYGVSAKKLTTTTLWSSTSASSQ